MRHQKTCCWILCFSSRLTCGLLKNHKTPQQLCCLMPNTPEQYQSNSIIAITVSQGKLGDYRFLLSAQGTFCIKPEGDVLVVSTQIRWFSRWSGGGGWSGRAEAQQRLRVSKLGWKCLSDYHSNKIAVETARRGARGPNKKGYSQEKSTQKRRAGQ